MEHPYSNYQCFSLHGDPEKRAKSIQEFIELGWLDAGTVTIITAPFHCVVWPRDKGQAVYPASHPQPE